jgi:two-component system, chemotaxis family, response regulator PixH
MAHTVLVVDDDPIVHGVLRRLLEGTEYHLARANNGREALELATRDLPHLIILDVLMPDIGGLAVLRQLKDAEATKGIPVIVLTSLAQRTTQLEATASGADLFLSKPFTEAQLLTALRKLLPEPR